MMIVPDGAIRPCPLCKAPALAFDAGTRRYARCPNCGLVSLDPSQLPAPDAERERYLLHRNAPDDGGYLAYLGVFVEAVSPLLSPGIRVLDYGSGPEPVLARLFEARGSEVTLWDPFFAPSPPEARAPFDLAVAHESAEHFHDPRAEFARIRTLLAPGGKVAIRTRLVPDGNADFARWWYREDATHVSFYAERTLRFVATLLGARGYERKAEDIFVFG